MPKTNLIPASLRELAVPIDDLKPYGKNPRRGNVSVIVESLSANGQYRPVVVRRETGEVLAGNHTLAAAKELGWSELAATYVDVDDDAAARIVLVDNRSSDLAGYDDDVLAELLDALPSLDGTGYDDDDLAALIGGLIDEPEALTDVDDAPDVPEGDTISREGDVWELGQHILLCGDSTDVSAVFDALQGERPDVVWTDPPYGVSYVGGTKDKLTIQNDGAEGLQDLLDGAFRTLATVAKAGAPVYIAHADTERMTFEGAMRGAGLIFRQNLVWVKHSLVMGRSDYHYKHEPILEGVAPGGPKGEGEKDEDAEEELQHDGLLYGFTPGGQGRLGRGGKRWYGDNKQTTVFDAAKPKRNDVHPTMKPVELIRKMLKNSLPPRGLVLDLFGGSGSTLIAAHHHGARAALVELDPKYADVICRRWQEHTGIKPILRSSGEARDFIPADA